MNQEWLGRLRRLVRPPESAPDTRDPSLAERRQQFRMSTSLPLLLKHQGEVLDAVVTDLNHQGARLMAPKIITPGSEVMLVDENARTGRSRVTGQVSWARRAETGAALLGMQFAGPVTHTFMREVLDKMGYIHPATFNSRRTRRVNATVPFELQDKNCFPLAWGSTLDLGLGGALLKLPFSLAEKEVVRLVLVTAEARPAMTLLGTVVSHRRTQGAPQTLHHLRFYTLLPEQRRELSELLIRHLRLHEEALWLPAPAPYRPSPVPGLATE